MKIPIVSFLIWIVIAIYLGIVFGVLLNDNISYSPKKVKKIVYSDTTISVKLSGGYKALFSINDSIFFTIGDSIKISGWEKIH